MAVTKLALISHALQALKAKSMPSNEVVLVATRLREEWRDPVYSAITELSRGTLTPAQFKTVLSIASSDGKGEWVQTVTWAIQAITNELSMNDFQSVMNAALGDKAMCRDLINDILQALMNNDITAAEFSLVLAEIVETVEDSTSGSFTASENIHVASEAHPPPPPTEWISTNQLNGELDHFEPEAQVSMGSADQPVNRLPETPKVSLPEPLDESVTTNMKSSGTNTKAKYHWKMRVPGSELEPNEQHLQDEINQLVANAQNVLDKNEWEDYGVAENIAQALRDGGMANPCPEQKFILEVSKNGNRSVVSNGPYSWGKALALTVVALRTASQRSLKIRKRQRDLQRAELRAKDELHAARAVTMSDFRLPNYHIEPLVLVVAPTKPEATTFEFQIKKLVNAGQLKISVDCWVGGGEYPSKIEEGSDHGKYPNVDIVIGTAGRLMEMLEKGTLSLSFTKATLFDHAKALFGSTLNDDRTRRINKLVDYINTGCAGTSFSLLNTSKMSSQLAKEICEKFLLKQCQGNLAEIKWYGGDDDDTIPEQTVINAHERASSPPIIRPNTEVQAAIRDKSGAYASTGDYVDNFIGVSSTDDVPLKAVKLLTLQDVEDLDEICPIAGYGPEAKCENCKGLGVCFKEDCRGCDMVHEPPCYKFLNYKCKNGPDCPDGSHEALWLEACSGLRVGEHSPAGGKRKRTSGRPTVV